MLHNHYGTIEDLWGPPYPVYCCCSRGRILCQHPIVPRRRYCCSAHIASQFGDCKAILEEDLALYLSELSK